MEACSVDTIKIQKNDIIILSSDGLWDVLEADDLQKIIERNTNKVNVKYFFLLYKIFL